MQRRVLSGRWFVLIFTTDRGSSRCWYSLGSDRETRCPRTAGETDKQADRYYNSCVSLFRPQPPVFPSRPLTKRICTASYGGFYLRCGDAFTCHYSTTSVHSKMFFFPLKSEKMNFVNSAFNLSSFHVNFLSNVLFVPIYRILQKKNAIPFFVHPCFTSFFFTSTSDNFSQLIFSSFCTYLFIPHSPLPYFMTVLDFFSCLIFLLPAFLSIKDMHFFMQLLIYWLVMLMTMTRRAVKSPDKKLQAIAAWTRGTARSRTASPPFPGGRRCSLSRLLPGPLCSQEGAVVPGLQYPHWAAGAALSATCFVLIKDLENIHSCKALWAVLCVSNRKAHLTRLTFGNKKQSVHRDINANWQLKVCFFWSIFRPHCAFWFGETNVFLII